MIIVLVPNGSMKQATAHISPKLQIELPDFLGVYDIKTRTVFINEGPEGLYLEKFDRNNPTIS